MRRDMVDRNDAFTISKQCELLNVSRGYFYYVPIGLSEADLNMLEKIDALYTEDPARGQRRIRGALKKQFGISLGRDSIRGYMIILGISAIYPKRDLSKVNKKHKKYPYLLRGVKIERINQVWSTDITYVRLKRGFVYLTAVIDWYSQYVLSWRLSTSLDRQFCIDVVNDAFNKHGKPEIFNTDQGSQYTSSEFVELIKSKGAKVSMDGKGRALDNVFVERLWRTVKYEDIFIKEYATVPQCRDGLGKFFQRYNIQREHQSIDYNYPKEVYYNEIEWPIAA